MSEAIQNNEKRVYLPGLDALRFFAALSVIIAHIELLKEQLYVPNSHEFMHRLNLGGLGVYFFFVLSGFLITYLLIHEKEKTGKIEIKQFYIRRVLRIWPLYFLITILGLFILPQFEMMHVPWLQQFFDANWRSNVILFCLMLPNAALAFMPAVPHAGQLWSIGVEEQFYLIWPVLFSKTKNLARLILLGIALLLFVKILFVLLLRFEILPATDTMLGIKKLIAMSKFECMLIGGFGAYLLKSNKSNWLELIYNKYTLLFTLCILPFMSYFCPPFLDDIVHLPYAILFLILILNVSSNEKSLIKLENSIFGFLGKISYGLYMYHMMIIVFVIQLAKKFEFESSPFFNWSIYPIIIGLSILISWLSFNYFETPFLTLKKKYTVVRSGKI